MIPALYMLAFLTALNVQQMDSRMAYASIMFWILGCAVSVLGRKPC